MRGRRNSGGKQYLILKPSRNCIERTRHVASLASCGRYKTRFSRCKFLIGRRRKFNQGISGRPKRWIVFAFSQQHQSDSEFAKFAQGRIRRVKSQNVAITQSKRRIPINEK